MSSLQEESEERYGKLKSFSNKNYQILSEKYSEEIDFIERTEFALCWLNRLLGEFPPRTPAEETIRDLMADVFDSFLSSKFITLGGFLNQPFPLLRRAFEGILLIRYLNFDPSKDDKWRKEGAAGRITPEETRKIPVGDEAFLTNLYDYYCTGTHINSMYIWRRLLGVKNKFTLGKKIFNINEMITREYIIRHIQLISFFRSVMVDIYEADLPKIDPDFLPFLEEISDERASELNRKLSKELENWKAEARKE